MAYWWVNQGQTFAAERQAGILWAPTAMANGGTRPYWTAMTDLVAGDVVFHYAHQRIMAVGRVRTPAQLHPRPASLPSQLWQQDGWLAELNSTDLETPIHRNEIPLEWRRPRQEPCFDVNGQVVLGYLFPLSDGFAGKLLDYFQDRWPPIPPVNPTLNSTRSLGQIRGLSGHAADADCAAW